MGTKYRLWVVDKTTNEVFHLDFESKEEAEKEMDWYLKNANFYVIKLESLEGDVRVDEIVGILQKEFPEAKVQKLGDGIYVKITKDEDYSEALETIDREFGNLHFQAGKYISGELFWEGYIKVKGEVVDKDMEQLVKIIKDTSKD